MLAYHVDYWDYLGWKDPYGSKEWSRLQKDYCAKLKSKQRYTPMMVLMGAKHMSNRAQAKKDFGTLLKEKSAAILSVEAKFKKGKIYISASAKTVKGRALPNGVKVIAVIAEDEIVSNPSRGENRGKKLKEGSIVRARLAGLDLGDKIKWTVEADDSWNKKNLRVVIFVQDPDTAQVYEAIQAKVKE